MNTQQDRPVSFKRELAQKSLCLGTWAMAGAPSTAEALGHAGFDWVLIDMEHSPIEMGDVWQMLQAVDGSPAHPIVRVARNDDLAAVKRALDLGARTIMFPYVQTVEEAERLVASAKYPPLGHRGFAAMHRASRYGTWTDYSKVANDITTCIVQLETPEAIDRLEAIAAVPGVDALFIGPGDLSAAVGSIGNVQSEEVKKLMHDAVRRARAVGIPVGTLMPTPALARTWLEAGYDYIAIASDLGMLMQRANEVLAAMKGVQKPTVSSGY
ncbi:HpcH/HpaI aldolase family protein [Paraburkholderia phosphatilytica]|uniref:HpcH/HpaI aldolase family protein n=1 Tax=Paraburkholderia phosphatilytica TaxID=2282883 RepID=UPI000E4CC17D|nr:aldolase/citrate lyase family protein [Paraburkholderia phosphatilytica]